MGRFQKWSLPIVAVIGVVGYLLISPAPSPSRSEPEQATASAPGYQLPPAALSAGQKQPIHVDEAFKLSMSAEPATATGGLINARFEIEPNYYLYRDKIKITGPDGVALEPSFPASKTKRDIHFGDSEVFEETFAFTVQVNATANDEITVSATYQGCENEGICYPPVSKQFDLKVSATQ